MSNQSFRELGVSAPVVAALVTRNIHDPFSIQQLVLPDAMRGLDVLVRSPTGSGKTLAFVLPIVERTDAADARPSALVLVPTRELAAHVTAEFQPLAKARGLSVAPAYGGVPLRSQAKRIKSAHILVATPGRLEDLASRKLVDLSGVSRAPWRGPGRVRGGRAAVRLFRSFPRPVGASGSQQRAIPPHQRHPGSFRGLCERRCAVGQSLWSRRILSGRRQRRSASQSRVYWRLEDTIGRGRHSAAVRLRSVHRIGPRSRAER